MGLFDFKKDNSPSPEKTDKGGKERQFGVGLEIRNHENPLIK
jgi:hypothetical protein